MKYRATYKCRMCGETYHSETSAGQNAAISHMAHLHVGVRGVDILAPNKTHTHHCGGDHAGSLGLADFQGWEAVPDE